MKDRIKVLIDKAKDCSFSDSYIGILFRGNIIYLEQLLAESEPSKYVVEKIKQQYSSDIRLLKNIHKLELDAISMKGLDEFIIWSNERKNKQPPQQSK